ncbi:hypothetical protein F5B19DRAFT_435976 [Rostrohypoxylon terebratum]|nr:hypothetical protein F5B19DRAFT_435976 [Rostrohypoxylon terebratum]
MISDLGLLTRSGMEYFYPVFKDMQNWMNPDYKDQFPQLPFPSKPKGEHAADEYRKLLVEMGYTRVNQKEGKGDLIRIKAIGVWDTVGALGIPQGRPREILVRLGVNMRSQEYRFYDTRLSPKIEHAFHALALDETRGPFRPTLWERRKEDGDTSDLRQVWFPGSHGNIGGGWSDEGVANLSIAWMMDQLSSVGCEFVPDALEIFYTRNVNFYDSLQIKQATREKDAGSCFGLCRSSSKEPLLWAARPIFDTNTPVRPWSLHSIQSSSSLLYELVGSVTRSPGLYRKLDPDNGIPRKEFLQGTNERIHSSVRVRLFCEGLGLNDSGLWECPALLHSWYPRRVHEDFDDPIPPDAHWGPGDGGGGINGPANNTNVTTGELIDGGAYSAVTHELVQDAKSVSTGESNSPGSRWVWEYVGSENDAPHDQTMVEDTLGPWEKHLLELSAGKVPVCGYADAQDIHKLKVFKSKQSKFRQSMKKWKTRKTRKGKEE